MPHLFKSLFHHNCKYLVQEYHIFCYGILNKIELILNNFWILILCLLIVVLVIIFRGKITIPLNKLDHSI